MNVTKSIVTLSLSLVLLTGCASRADDQATSASTNTVEVERGALLRHYQEITRDIEHNPDNQNLVLVRNEAMTVGTQAGFYWAANELNSRLNKYSKLLDQIDFRPLLIEQPRYFIIPPVIAEDDGRKLIDDTGRYLRLVDKAYYIERKPQFALNPPTWRDYLYLSAPAPMKPSDALLPTNDEEREVWRKAVTEGFALGVEQAQLSVQSKIAHLTNDYQGMVRYQILLTKNMVSAPIVRESYAPVNGGGDRLIIEDSTVHIEVTSQLNANRYSWDVVPQLPDISHLFPEDIYLNILE